MGPAGSIFFFPLAVSHTLKFKLLLASHVKHFEIQTIVPISLLFMDLLHITATSVRRGRRSRQGSRGPPKLPPTPSPPHPHPWKKKTRIQTNDQKVRNLSMEHKKFASLLDAHCMNFKTKMGMQKRPIPLREKVWIALFCSVLSFTCICRHTF